MREIGDGDHDGGRVGTFLFPPLAGFVPILPKPRVIADNNTGSLDEAGFDGVVEAEVADDPLEQSFLAAALAGRSEGGGGEIEAAENAASAVNAVEAPNPLGGFFQFLFCDSFE